MGGSGCGMGATGGTGADALAGSRVFDPSAPKAACAAEGVAHHRLSGSTYTGAMTMTNGQPGDATDTGDATGGESDT